MKNKCTLFSLFYLLSRFPVKDGSFVDKIDEIPEEQKLLNTLMSKYEKSVRPVRNASETVTVKMGLTLAQIFDMDEKNQILVTNVWLDQEWHDKFLTWNPVEFGNLSMIRIPCHMIWKPDIVLYNNAAEYTNGMMPAKAMVSSTGDVFWPVPTKLLSSCKFDVTYFPFDDQFCKLKFGSWTYDGFQVDMINRTTQVDLSNYVESGEWELIGIEIERNVVFYGCCDEPYPDVTFRIHIRRRTLYYLYNVIFPCIMMSTLTLLVFRLPPESGEKVTMGITVLLAFSVFMLSVAERLPETSEFIPLLSVYLTVVMAMTSVSVIMTVIVLNLHYRGPKQQAVPRWLKSLLRVSESKKLSNDRIGVKIERNGLTIPVDGLARELTDELPESRQDRVLDALNRIIDRYEKDEFREMMEDEWRQVAVSVDCILFWLFLFFTLLSTVIILIIAPLSKPI